jgi:excisionase family DNA binding protein
MAKTQRQQAGSAETQLVQAVSTGDLVKRRLLYPVAEAAHLLGVHRTTLYDFAREGRLELVRSGSRTYVTAAELERYLAEELEPARLNRTKTA